MIPRKVLNFMLLCWDNLFCMFYVIVLFFVGSVLLCCFVCSMLL